MESWITPVGNGQWDPRQEYLIKDETKTKAQCIAALPTDCAPGSTAYKASLTLMLMYNGTAWVEIGGEAE